MTEGIHNNLREILSKEGITQIEFAKTSGISSATIGAICNDRSSGNPTTQGKVVKWLKKMTGSPYSLNDVFPPNTGR
jgi:transcriptional regulator with XRE-family HTH domain